MRARPLRAAFAALGTAGVIAAVVLTATPAVAADTGFVASGILTADENNAIVMAVSGGPGKAYPAMFVGAGHVTDVSLTFDFAGLDGVATPSFPDPSSDCSISGTTGTCAIPDIDSADGVELQIPLMLTPAAGATDGATANFQMTASGTGAPTDKEKITVKVADGPDLVVSPSDNEIATTPGARTALAYTFTNTGSEDATDIVETFFFTHGFVPDAFDNCEYEPLDFIGGTAAICTFDGSLAPSAGASVNFTGSVGDDAADMELASSDVYTNLTMSDFEKNAFARKTRGAIAKHFAPRSHSGKKLALKKASSARSADDIDLSDNFAFVILDVKTSHDAVVGDYALKGAVGDTSTAYLIMKNDGPASLNFVNGEEISALLITVPQFAEVTKVPSDCGGLKSPSADPFTGARGKPGYRYYACLDETDLYLPAGGLLRYAFEFKITKDHGADGSYKILPKTAAANGDSDLSNNTAKISLNLTGDGSLPVTGSKVGIIGGVGGALVLLGGVLLVLGRRRKRAAAV